LCPHWLATHASTRAIVGWNAMACLYLALAGIMMARSSQDRMCQRARLQDDGKLVILILVIVAAVASLGAIVVELGLAKDMKGTPKYTHIGLAGFTILSSWAFTHMMFALHYAHDYCVASARGRPGGLEFPGEAPPGYADFLYFAYVIGTSGQTADVAIASRSMRLVGLVHCVLAFVFNTTVLALTINIAASLL